MEREACVCDHGFERSDLCAEIIIIIIAYWYILLFTQAPIRVRSDGTAIRYYPLDSVLYCLVWLCLEALHGD